jgi:CHASE3 domain sensor protein
MGLLIFVGSLSYRSIRASDESARWVAHTRDVLKSIQYLRYSMEAITSNVRGYLITGSDSYLDTYRTNLLDVEQHKENVHNLTVDNPVQQIKLATLDRLIAHRIERGELLITLQ